MKTLSTFLISLAVIAFGISLFLIFMGLDSVPTSQSFAFLGYAKIFFFLSAIFFVCWWGIGKVGRQGYRKNSGLIDTLSRGKVAVIPTDTTYGIVGLASNEKTVNEIYRLRKRDLDKPFIVLIADRKDLKNFGVSVSPEQEKILDRVWPGLNRSVSVGRTNSSDEFVLGPTSVILNCTDDKFSYLNRGKKTLAFRLPAKESLRKLIREVGPLVAPSANPQGHNVAKTISEAKAYFGHNVDIYEDGGTITASPSRLIDITDRTEKVLR